MRINPEKLGAAISKGLFHLCGLALIFAGLYRAFGWDAVMIFGGIWLLIPMRWFREKL